MWYNAKVISEFIKIKKIGIKKLTKILNKTFANGENPILKCKDTPQNLKGYFSSKLKFTFFINPMTFQTHKSFVRLQNTI